MPLPHGLYQNDGVEGLVSFYPDIRRVINIHICTIKQREFMRVPLSSRIYFYIYPNIASSIRSISLAIIVSNVDILPVDRNFPKLEIFFFNGNRSRSTKLLKCGYRLYLSIYVSQASSYCPDFPISHSGQEKMTKTVGMTLLSSREGRIAAIEGLLRYSFQDKDLLLQALSLPGSISYTTGNKGLAQIGDAVIQLQLVLEGYQRGMQRGRIATILGRISSNRNLEEVGVKNKLGLFIFTNHSQAGVISPGSMATTVEALLGAVYIDSKKNMDQLRISMNALGLSFSGRLY